MARKSDDTPEPTPGVDTIAAPSGETLETETTTTLEEATKAGYFGTRVAHPGPTEDVTVNRAQSSGS